MRFARMPFRHSAGPKAFQRFSAPGPEQSHWDDREDVQEEEQHVALDFGRLLCDTHPPCPESSS